MRPAIAIEMQCEDGRFFLPPEYDALIDAAGAQPVHIRPDLRGSELESALGRCRGLVFPGGDDVGAHLFGQMPAPGSDAPVPERDAFEPAALGIALRDGMPFLGICRGMQMLNVFAGGTLVQRLETGLDHWPAGNAAQPVHGVTFAEGSHLARIAKTASARVNSLHHQGVGRLGAGVAVEAVADDGVVEALRLQSAPFALGVQWHPELMPDEPLSRKIAAAFVAACVQT